MANTLIKVYKKYWVYRVYKNDIYDDSLIGLLDEREKRKRQSERDRKHKVVRKHLKNQNGIRLDNIKRAKDKINDIAMLNDFKYFVTFTFNDKIVNAKDYDRSIKVLKKWLDNMVQRNELLYLLVPELHKSGRIHFHALMSGKLTLVDSGHKDNAQRIIYNVANWKYGFSTAVEISGEYVAICRYITKYITKDLTKITGNYYYSGGHGIVRKPEKYYANEDYEKFEGKEYTIPNIFTTVKYLVKPI